MMATKTFTNILLIIMYKLDAYFTNFYDFKQRQRCTKFE